MKVYLNKELVDKKDAKISVFDHGYLYGDGVFEGIRVYDKLVFKLKEHIDRLYESAHTLMLNIPLTKTEMIKDVVKTLQANKLKDAYEEFNDSLRNYGEESFIIDVNHVRFMDGRAVDNKTISALTQADNTGEGTAC